MLCWDANNCPSLPGTSAATADTGKPPSNKTMANRPERNFRTVNTLLFYAPLFVRPEPSHLLQAGRRWDASGKAAGGPPLALDKKAVLRQTRNTA